jgi:cation diffusion facilitator CzcD-associated flavoprotein CzcO
MGPLTEPKIPEIPGLDSFEGKTFHSARWDHDYDLSGKRVASIGTGASAIQYVPAIQPEVRQLHVFQRTPPWIAPHGNRPITDLERRIYRTVPAAQRLVRAGVYVGREALVLGIVKRPRLMKIVERVAEGHMRRYVSDPELIRKVKPDYTIGCKRILPSNRWYRTLTQPNVELVTDGVKEVRPRSIVSADGVEREVDAIVFGTGFYVTEMPAAQYVRGRHGDLLSEAWDQGPRAYLGTAAPGFPNMFLLLGPNTGLGHSSMVYMIESQIQYVLDALRTMRDRQLETVEVLESSVDRYNEELERKMEGTVWSTGCASWYLDDTGRNATQWPDWTWRFRQRTARFDPSDYAVRTGAPARERVPVAA